ncbi:MAG: cupin domain-containing protein [Tessaracoccus sp.]|uniref:cupin domain-containing protein n=1 Tax=Tessaracoccus sp. TaxID=1971211 RepID=UPI001ED50EE2|nr:cupin domain-containing protein [Tessaracoccus sp.]MBK7819807.1 cupin domain-containing protein [Tessaracoccus sp.]
MNEQQHTVTGNVKHFIIDDVVKANPDFRKVLWTGEHSQLVVMTIPVGGEIGDEVHDTTDQLLTFISGTGQADLDGHTHAVDAGDLCAVPAGTRHNFRNTGDEPLVLYTVYSPPEHSIDAVYATKELADAAEASGEDAPPQGAH